MWSLGMQVVRRFVRRRLLICASPEAILRLKLLVDPRGACSFLGPCYRPFRGSTDAFDALLLALITLTMLMPSPWQPCITLLAL